MQNQSAAAKRAWETRRRETGQRSLDVQNEIERAVVKAARAAIARARQNGLDHDLDLPEAMLEAVRRSELKCALSGVALKLEVHGAGAAPRPYAPSIDRINSQGGYTVQNCRVVAWAMNCFCGVWGQDIALEIARSFVERDVRNKGVEQ